MTPRSIAEIKRLRRRQHPTNTEEVAAAQHPPRAEATPGTFTRTTGRHLIAPAGRTRAEIPTDFRR
jgi:hypothetical protein